MSSGRSSDGGSHAAEVTVESRRRARERSMRNVLPGGELNDGISVALDGTFSTAEALHEQKGGCSRSLF
jgi:hypothetical protein